MENSKIIEAMRNVIHYTDEYFDLINTVLDLKIDDATRNELSTKIFTALAAAEEIAYEGRDRGNVRGKGKLIES